MAKSEKSLDRSQDPKVIAANKKLEEAKQKARDKYIAAAMPHFRVYQEEVIEAEKAWRKEIE